MRSPSAGSCVDWDYQLRWYPPTPVNVADGDAPDPVVRAVNDADDAAPHR